MKLIELYKQWMETGAIPDSGLCYSLPKKYRDEVYMFHPNKAEVDVYSRYWGHGNKREKDNLKILFAFTPLRQTIVLLICAMNNEL